jgi:hypothetical protein
MHTDEIIQQVRARFDHAAARRLLQEKYEARMIFPHAGGMWRAGPDLQALLLTCPDSTAVLLDLYQTPIRIQVQELMDMSRQRWQEQMNAWLIEFENIAQQR